jgi:hypothetical protein
MAQPRYNEELQNFIRQWRPNDPELDERFIGDVRKLLEAILKPPANLFEVETILTPGGGKVIVRLGDYEAQLEPVAAHHLALSLIEAAASARIESWLFRFMNEQTKLPDEITVQMIAAFRQYRVEELQKELAGDLAKQTVPMP